MVYKLTFFSLVFELAAVWLLFSGSRDAQLIYEYLALHAGGSALFACAGLLLAPARYRSQPRLLLGLLFALNFLIPLVSLVAEIAGLLLYRLLPTPPKEIKFATVVRPRFTTERSHGGTGFRGGEARSQLGDPRAPVDQRLQALIAVQDTPIRAIGPLLRNLLADPVDDLRLLAYGILDAREKAITRSIVDARAQLNGPLDAARRFDANKNIAELYWELIYQNLVQGDMLLFSNQQAREHAARALAIDGGDAGLWFLTARLQLAHGDVREARRALLQAQVHAFPAERLAPYFAELEFFGRRFERVRELMAQIDGGPPAFDAARRYWSTA